MLTKVENPTLEKLSFRDAEIILNGPPGRLEGSVILENKNDTTLRIRGIPLKSGKDAKSGDIPATSLGLHCKLVAGEQRVERVFLNLPHNTPPGNYEKLVPVGGRNRKVRIIVQPTIEIEVHPDEFTFQDSAPGRVHQAIFTLTNLGNLPFQVPEIKHVAALDMDYLCRAFGVAFRENDEEGLNATLDRVTKNIKENLTNWADAKVKEAGKLLRSGDSMVITLNITMPKDADPKNDYNGNVRFWDKDLSFVIKSHIPNTKTGKNAK